MHKTQKSLSSLLGNRMSRSLKDVGIVSPKSAETNDIYAKNEANYDDNSNTLNI